MWHCDKILDDDKTSAYKGQANEQWWDIMCAGCQDNTHGNMRVTNGLTACCVRTRGDDVNAAQLRDVPFIY